MRYIKETPRLNVQFLDSNTEEVVFEVSDRTWMNVGELLSDTYVTEIFNQNNIKKPEKLLVLVVGEYNKVN